MFVSSLFFFLVLVLNISFVVGVPFFYCWIVSLLMFRMGWVFSCFHISCFPSASYFHFFFSFFQRDRIRGVHQWRVRFFLHFSISVDLNSQRSDTLDPAHVRGLQSGGPCRASSQKLISPIQELPESKIPALTAWWHSKALTPYTRTSPYLIPSWRPLGLPAVWPQSEPHRRSLNFRTKRLNTKPQGCQT